MSSDRIKLICPECDEPLSVPKGWDIWAHDEDIGYTEEDQYFCESCRRFVFHQKIFSKGTFKEELVASEVI